ncbi:MAG: L,D-transpeptidase family protein [Bacteroidetes bacterium]|nr:L,D-transpeptidase family protein [Bacteroidota bacterium]
MPQRSNRLRIHPAAIAMILLMLGGSAVVVYQVSGTGDLPWTDELPWAETDPFEGLDEVIRAQLVGDSTGYALLNGERITLHPKVAQFYLARAYAPAWTDVTARDTLVALLRATADVGLDPEGYHTTALQRRGEMTVADSIGSLADQDLLLTHAVFALADDLSGPRVDVDELYGSNWFATHRTLRADTLLAAALADPHPAAAVAQAIERLHPQHPGYRALRAMVTHQRSLVEREDWPTILPGRAIAPGDTSALVPALRDRMQLESLALPHPAGPLRMVYDEALAEAVRAFQTSQGIEANGVIALPTREAMNTRPTGDVIPLLTLNLERWRWLPQDLGDFHVLVNIPSFDLAVRERNGDTYTENFRMNTVVGRRSWATPVFSDTMTQIVFNPTWTIPASIQMESYGRVNPRGMVRDPGPSNPMGRVKFLFPNDHAIIIHDTPSRWAFSQNQRAYSHGCIRAHEAGRLAEEILTRTNAWTVEDVEAKFSGPWRLQNVELDTPVPVHLVYFTAWVSENGQLQTYGDVYGHDAKLAEALGIELGARG